jgi:hypothetical protein
MLEKSLMFSSASGVNLSGISDDLKQEVSVKIDGSTCNCRAFSPITSFLKSLNAFQHYSKKKVWRTHDMSHLLCHNTEHIENTTRIKGEN